MPEVDLEKLLKAEEAKKANASDVEYKKIGDQTLFKGKILDAWFSDYGECVTKNQDEARKILNKKLRVHPNPCLDWMVACTEVVSDANGNIRPVKPDIASATKHIDGVIAAMMALDRAVRHQTEGSIYERRGVISV